MSPFWHGASVGGSAIILWLALASCIQFFWLHPAIAAEDTTTEFTRRLQRRLELALPGASVEIIDKLQLRVHRLFGAPADPIELVINLDNVLQSYREDASREAEVVDHFVNGIVEAYGPEQGLDPSNILAIVKDRGWLSGAAQLQGATPMENSTLVTKPLTTDLVIVYAEVGRNEIAFIDTKDMIKNHLDYSQLQKISQSNLESKLSQLEMSFQAPFWLVRLDSNYETSLILLESFWSRIRAKIGADIIFAVPARGWLILVDAKDGGGVKNLELLAKNIASTEPYPITDKLFVYRKGKIEEHQRD